MNQLNPKWKESKLNSGGQTSLNPNMLECFDTWEV